MWTIISKDRAAEFARVNVDSIDDLWYDEILGTIEVYTGWYSLENGIDVTERRHGSNSPLLLLKSPINSISSIIINGSLLSSSAYDYDWNKVYMINESSDAPLAVFSKGIKNIIISYNVGGTDSLPSKYLNALQMTMLLCMKEYVAIPRGEGSDQTLRKYRPDRTQAPEEVLQSQGIHGKIQGILRVNLPSRIRVT